MYGIIRKGLLTHGLKLFSVLVPSGCPFGLLPFLVGWRYNYLGFSLQVVKFSTKFCSSNSGVVNALTARNYSTLPWRDLCHQCSVENFQPDPLWVTGFVDGEGCFYVSVTKNKKYKLGWEVRPSFIITQHVRDKTLLYEIKNYFGVGHVTRQGPKAVQLRVQSFAELEKILMHFHKYPLKTKKHADLKLLIMIVEKMRRKEHSTPAGWRKIVAIKAAMNLGLSDKLKIAFPYVVRPLGGET